MTPASQDSTVSLPAEKMALLRDLVRDLLKALSPGGVKEVPIRDDQGNLLAHVVPAQLACLVEVNLGDDENSPTTEEGDIPAEELLARWRKNSSNGD